MNDWPKCLTCGALLVVNGYYSIGYCPGSCLDTCLIHGMPISSPDGIGPECPMCKVARVAKEERIEKERTHVA
jgi:hypothetical protein